MKRILTLVLSLLLATPMFAHTASLSWTNSPDTPNTNVYRLAATCPGTLTGFTKLTSTPVTTATYTDSTVLPGVYCYYVTAITGGAESVPSNAVTVTIPVAPPSGLAITSVSMNVTGNTETVVAKWTDTSGVQQSYFFSDGTEVLNQGLTSSLTGTFAQQASFPAGTPVTFNVCNTSGTCASQKAM